MKNKHLVSIFFWDFRVIMNKHLYMLFPFPETWNLHDIKLLAYSVLTFWLQVPSKNCMYTVYSCCKNTECPSCFRNSTNSINPQTQFILLFTFYSNNTLIIGNVFPVITSFVVFLFLYYITASYPHSNLLGHYSNNFLRLSRAICRSFNPSQCSDLLLSDSISSEFPLDPTT